jgi:RHS repeat-associated protein
LPAPLPRTRTPLTTRTRWRSRVSVRRRASGRVHCNYFRDYDPAVGRYIESDPIGLDGGWSTYVYANANPISWMDPEGLEAGTITLPRRLPPRRIPIPGWRGPAGQVAGAGWLGWQAGSALYPHIAMPLGDAIDYMCSDNPREECLAKCDAAYEVQATLCRMLRTKQARKQCWANAANLLGECQKQCK